MGSVPTSHPLLLTHLSGLPPTFLARPHGPAPTSAWGLRPPPSPSFLLPRGPRLTERFALEGESVWQRSRPGTGLPSMGAPAQRPQHPGALRASAPGPSLGGGSMLALRPEEGPSVSSGPKLGSTCPDDLGLPISEMGIMRPTPGSLHRLHKETGHSAQSTMGAGCPSAGSAGPCCL